MKTAKQVRKFTDQVPSANFSYEWPERRRQAAFGA